MMSSSVAPSNGVIEIEETAEIADINESNEQPQIPDGGWGWVVVISSFVASMVYDGISYSYGVLTTEFIDHYNISRTVVGLMGSFLFGMTLCSGPIVSILCNKFGYRIVTIVGSIISAVGLSAPFFYSDLWFLILSSSVLTGIGFGMIYLSSIVMVNLYFNKKRGLAIGIAVCGSGMGTFVFSPIIEILIAKYGWRGSMLITGGIALNCIPCGLLYRNLPSSTKSVVSKTAENNDTESDEVQSAIKKNGFKKNLVLTCKIMSNPIFLLLGVTNFLNSIGLNSPFIYAKDRAVTAGISSVKASFLISSMGIGNCLGRVIFGYLATTRFVNRFHVYSASLIISGGILIASWGVAIYELMVAYTFAFGFMLGAYVALTSLVLVDLLGLENLNFTFGIISIFQGVAVFIGPPLAGYVFDATRSFNAAFLFCGVFLVISGSIMYFAYMSNNFKEKLKTFRQ